MVRRMSSLVRMVSRTLAWKRSRWSVAKSSSAARSEGEREGEGSAAEAEGALAVPGRVSAGAASGCGEAGELGVEVETMLEPF